MIEHIHSLDDPRVADYRNVRDAELARSRGAFLAEGELVVRTLLREGRFPVRSLLLTPTRLGTMRDAVEAAGQGLPVYLAEQGVMDAIVGFHIHRGCLAAGARAPDPGGEAVIGALGGGPATVVVLESIANHDNVGGVFRNAAAFGAGAVLLDAQSCDPLYRKAIRVSMGCALRVAFSHSGDTASHIRLLRAHGFTVCALTPAADAEDVFGFARRTRAGRVALVLGAEGPGLRAETIAACGARLRIDIEPGVDSLNVAAASAVALAALRSAGDAR